MIFPMTLSDLWRSFQWFTYFCYFVSAAYVRSVSDSWYFFAKNSNAAGLARIGSLVQSVHAITRSLCLFYHEHIQYKKVSLQCRHECLLIYLHYPAVQQINYSSWWWTCTLHISTVLMCTWCVVNNEFSVCNTVLGLVSYLAQSTFAFGVRSLDVLYNYIHHHMLAKSKQNAHKTRRALGGAHIPPTKVCRRLTASVNETS